eukprot:s498_g8.t1
MAGCVPLRFRTAARHRGKAGYWSGAQVQQLGTHIHAMIVVLLKPYASAQPSKRREHSTSTALPSRGGEGLHNDSLLTLSSESVERHRFLSRNAISAAVAEHGEDQEKPIPFSIGAFEPIIRGLGRWKLPKGPLPKLVDVRKNGPGDVEAAKRAEKGHKASVSAAMVQAARMQPKRLRTPSKTAAEKPLSQAESRASLTEAKVVHFNQDPVEQSQDYEILSGERSSESPARSSRSGRSSRGGARSMSRPSSGPNLDGAWLRVKQARCCRHFRKSASRHRFQPDRSVCLACMAELCLTLSEGPDRPQKSR